MAQKTATFVPADSNTLQEKLINAIMLDGKKHLARRIFRDCLEVISQKIPDKDPQEVFDFAIRNVMPNIEVRPRRVGGAVYQIPVEVRPSRQQTLAIRWLITSARARKGMPMSQRLAAEIIDATNDQGAAFKKKESVKQMAKANKAFAHLARY